MRFTFRSGEQTWRTADITAVALGTPVVITAPNHGIINNWPVALFGIQGPVALNSNDYPPPHRDLRPATVIDDDTISINADSSAGMPTYVGGGSVCWPTPWDLTGATARFRVWEDPDRTGVPVMDLTDLPDIMIDTFMQNIIVQQETVGLTWNTGYYSLEVTYPSGITACILVGTLIIT